METYYTFSFYVFWNCIILDKISQPQVVVMAPPDFKL